MTRLIGYMIEKSAGAMTWNPVESFPDQITVYRKQDEALEVIAAMVEEGHPRDSLRIREVGKTMEAV